MKNILLLLTLFISTLSFSQEKLVKVMPNIGQGYLVLNEIKETKISFYEVTLIHRVFNEDGTFHDYSVKLDMKYGSTYVKFPSYVYTDGDFYLFSVTAYDSGKNVITTEGPIPLTDKTCNGCGNYPKVCSKKCNGTTYAWEINAYQGSGSNFYFSLDPVANYFDEESQVMIPYYQYMSETQFNAVVNDWKPWDRYYNVPNWWDRGLYIIEIPNTFPHKYLDNQNAAITSPVVYGVQKYLGDWTSNGSNSANITPIIPFAIDQYELCNKPKSWFIDEMNSKIDFSSKTNWNYQPMPELECIPAYTPYTGGGVSNPNPFSGNLFLDCMEDVSLDSNINSQIDQLMDCVYDYDIGDTTSSSGTTTTGNGWFNVIDAITLSRIDTKAEVKKIVESDIYKPNGEYTGFRFAIEPGLYALGLVFKNGFYLPIVKECKQRSEFNYKLADFLEAKSYPNPILNNQFELYMKASAKVKFDYVLYDFFGNEIYRKNFVLQQYEERTFTVKPNVEIPHGMLINRFIFEDGSQLTFQSYRN